jgi:hypothetical protein
MRSLALLTLDSGSREDATAPVHAITGREDVPAYYRWTGETGPTVLVNGLEATGAGILGQ